MKKSGKTTASITSALSLVYKVCAGALAGGILFAGLAYYFGHSHLALGLLLGAFLAPLNLLALTSMTGRILHAGPLRGRSVFWARYVMRWFFFAMVIWVLIQISILCLIGALLSYIWFLAVLAFVGLRNASRDKSTLFSSS